VNNNDARRFAAMVGAPNGNTTIIACPHPDYMDKIETVTNTQDPF
jgi:hypothetical protein